MRFDVGDRRAAGSFEPLTHLQRQQTRAVSVEISARLGGAFDRAEKALMRFQRARRVQQSAHRILQFFERALGRSGNAASSTRASTDTDMSPASGSAFKPQIGAGDRHRRAVGLGLHADGIAGHQLRAALDGCLKRVGEIGQRAR